MKFKLGIIGGGKIGAGLIKLFAREKIATVVLLKRKEKIKALEREILAYQKRKSPGRTPAEIKFTASKKELAKCNLIIEAIDEDFNKKVKLYQSLKKVIDKNTIIATTTSSLSINKLAKATKLDTQLVGVHFFNPPLAIPFLEIIPGERFNRELLKKVIALIKTIDYDFVIVPDIPGFVANRVLFSLLLSAVELIEEGIKEKDIDKIVKSALKHPMGPFELINLIGIEMVGKIIGNLYIKDKRKIELWRRYCKRQQD